MADVAKRSAILGLFVGLVKRRVRVSTDTQAHSLGRRGPVLAYLALIVVNGAMAFLTYAVVWMVAVTGA